MIADHKLCLTYQGSAGALYTEARPNYMDFGGVGDANGIVGQTIDLFNTLTHANGQAVRIKLQVAEAFAGGTSLDWFLYGDDDVAFGSATTLASDTGVAANALTEGLDLIPSIPYLSNTMERYLRLSVDINTSAFTAGQLFGAVVVDEQSN